MTLYYVEYHNIMNDTLSVCVSFVFFISLLVKDLWHKRAVVISVIIFKCNTFCHKWC